MVIRLRVPPLRQSARELHRHPDAVLAVALSLHLEMLLVPDADEVIPDRHVAEPEHRRFGQRGSRWHGCIGGGRCSSRRRRCGVGRHRGRRVDRRRRIDRCRRAGGGSSRHRRQ